MDKNKAIVCREPELRKKAASLRLLLLEKEHSLLSLMSEICMDECRLKDFFKVKVEPRVGHLKKRLENLKFLVLGYKEAASKSAKENTILDPLQEKELKRLYRNLAKIYHPDCRKDNEEKKFFLSRMKEINEAFINRDLNALRSMFKKSAREIEGEKSALWIVESLKEEIKITESVISVYIGKLADLRKSKRYSLMNLDQKDLDLEISKMETELRREIEVYSSILYGRNKNK